jgi:hypothetical protein
LLQARSGYFKAMLSGSWVESSSDGLGLVRIHWPRDQFVKLLRFFHGHPFVEQVGDLQVVVECGSFFDVPELFGEANDWIASNLSMANAPMLWDFVSKEPRLWLSGVDGHADAKDACLDFHLRHFAELAEDPEEGDGSWVPLHDLSCALMRELLSTGLITLPKDALMEIVERFAGAKCGGRQGKEFNDLIKGMRPPAVMFNRELRDLLTGTVEASIRTVL